MIRIVADESAPVPRPITVTLACDIDHGLFPVEASFTNPQGFQGCYSDAMGSGWKESRRNGERIFLCPACSKKAPRSTANADDE